MARINLKRAIMLLVTGRVKPDPTGQIWQTRSLRLTTEIPEPSRLRSEDIEHIRKTPLVKRREVRRRDGPNGQYCSSHRFCRIIVKSAEELIACAAVGM